LGLPAIAQDFSLNSEEVSFYCGGAAEAPKQGSEPQHKLALDGGAGVKVCDDSGFETPVVFDILDDFDDGFSTQSVPYGILSRSHLARCTFWASAFGCIAPIGFDLS
jgi:hypothetical protein